MLTCDKPFRSSWPLLDEEEEEEDVGGASEMPSIV